VPRYLELAKGKLRTSVIVGAYRLLDKKDRNRTLQVLFAQFILAFLDLLGVAIIGVLGALVVSSSSSKGPGDRVSYVLEFLGLAEKNVQTQAIVLGILSAVALIFKTFASMLLLRKMNRYLSLRSARISADTIAKTFQLPFLRLRQNTFSYWQYQLTSSIDILTTSMLSMAITMISDIVLLFVLVAGLFYLDPAIATFSILLFSGSAFLVYKKQHKKALLVGSELNSLNLRINELLHLGYESYRDLFVRFALKNTSNTIRDLRIKSAELVSLRNYMPYVGKYTLEISMVLGFLFIAGSQFYLNEVGRAVANITVFFISSARISPAILRIQQGFLMYRGNRAQAEIALGLIREVNGLVAREEPSNKKYLPSMIHQSVRVSFTNVSFKYPKNDNFRIENLTFNLEAGSRLALIGSSGSGKSTVADLLLGILEPSGGQIKIQDIAPSEFHKKFPGCVAYVPQRPVIVNASVRENLALGLEVLSVDEKPYWEALKLANVADLVDEFPEGLDTVLGPGGVDLSGGQVQRLALARAFFTKPGLILLDEATSSLDGKTENIITNSLDKLEGNVTLVVIAHRLSTIKNFENIMYMNQGSLKAVGNLNFLMEHFPDVAEQASLVTI
jgi:ATP-binding cassette, subfamily B, bacterial PglK